MDLYHPSGEMSVRLMVLALLPGPLADVFGPNRFLRAWLAIRRNLGVAAFGYAMLHVAIYALDMQQLSAMLAELPIPGIWTGWFALLAMAIPAAISFDAHHTERIQRSATGRERGKSFLLFAGCNERSIVDC